MNVINIHERVIHQPKEKVSALVATLAGHNDQVWPKEKWPAMKFDQGLKEGSKGGHGPIRYFIDKYDPGTVLKFTFTGPKGFSGGHRFEISELGKDQTLLKHTIDMNTSGTATVTWALGIRWLHDALTEDALDKVENHFSEEKKMTEWNVWVKILRGILR